MSAMLSATRNTNAWIVAGGSDKGIMKLVGDALATSHQATTAIGIAPWGTIKGRTELTDDSEAQRELEESLYACTVRPPHLTNSLDAGRVGPDLRLENVQVPL